MTSRRVTVFCSYSHRDDKYRQTLETCLSVLRNQGLIADWSDRCIDPGTEWATQIAEQLDAAQVVGSLRTVVQELATLSDPAPAIEPDVVPLRP